MQLNFIDALIAAFQEKILGQKIEENPLQICEKQNDKYKFQKSISKIQDVKALNRVEDHKIDW